MHSIREEESSHSMKRCGLRRLTALVVCLLSPLELPNSAVAVYAETPPSRARKAEYQEPAPDPTIPVGMPNPPFAGDTPGDAYVVNRTGTYGGSLVLAKLGEVDTFNPVEPKGATSQELRSILFSGLVSYRNAAWKHEQGLAKSWQVSDDHLVWTFTVRQGVTWSDGMPFTIDDVKFSFDVAFDARYKTSIQDGFRDSKQRLPTVSITSPWEIRFQTQEVCGQFLIHVGNVMMIPKHKWLESYVQGKLLEQMTNAMNPSDLVTCGPFVLSEYVPAEKVVFARNPSYWKVDARGQRLPYLDRIVIAILKDMNLQWQKFEAGEHHLLEDLPPDHYREAEALEKSAAGSYELARLGVNLNTTWLCWNLHPGVDPETQKPFVDESKQHWFHNLKFRQALNHAIDRDGLVRAAFQGRGKAIWSAFTPGNKQWHNPNVPRYEFSVEKANALLDELGWKRDPNDPDGYRRDDRGNLIQFSLTTNVENNMRQQCGALVQSSFRKVGVKADFTPITFNSLVDQLQDSHKWDAIILGWGSGVPPDPSNGKNIHVSSGRLHAWYPQQSQPATPWEARIDELLGMMDREIKDDVRKAHCDEVEKLESENCPMYYLVAPNAYAMAKSSVGNLWPSVLRPQLTWNIEELYLKNSVSR